MQTEAVDGWSKIELISYWKVIKSHQMFFVPTELVFPKIVKVGEIQ